MAGAWSIHVEEHPYAGQRSLFIVCDQKGEGRQVMTDFIPRAFNYGMAMPATDALLTEGREERQDNCGDVTNFLQSALQSAWDLGMRPAGYEDARGEIAAVKGQLAAVRDHLSDMRKLAKVPGA